MRSRLSLTRGVASLAIVLSIGAVGVHAQQPQPSSPPSSETGTTQPPDEPFRVKEAVEVTATRGKVDRVASPASSAVVLRPELERRNVTTVDQALIPVEGSTAIVSAASSITRWASGCEGSAAARTGRRACWCCSTGNR